MSDIESKRFNFWFQAQAYAIYARCKGYKAEVSMRNWFELGGEFWCVDVDKDGKHIPVKDGVQ